jgi:hypothetical protein
VGLDSFDKLTFPYESALIEPQSRTGEEVS